MGMEDRSWYVPDDERRGYAGGGGVRLSFGPKTPPATKILIIVMIGCYILQLVMEQVSPRTLIILFSFVPADAVAGFQVWRFITYMFLHGDPFHLLINMFIFWMFAREVEIYFGWRQFLVLFFASGIAGGAVTSLFPAWYWIQSIGASAGVLGLLAVWGLLWPNRTILFMFIFPMKAKWLVIIMAAIDMLSALRLGEHSEVANLGHLGGMAYAATFMFLVPRLDSLLTRRAARASFREVEEDFDVRKRVDDLLDKINREGIASLSAREKKFLKDASKRYKK